MLDCVARVIGVPPVVYVAEETLGFPAVARLLLYVTLNVAGDQRAYNVTVAEGTYVP
jgi:hypothetical protein